jgi:hypothetical protein
VTSGAALDRVTEASISQGKVLSPAPVFCARVDPVQRKFSWAQFPPSWSHHGDTAGSRASPEPRSLTGKCCQSMLMELAAFQLPAFVHRLEFSLRAERWHFLHRVPMRSHMWDDVCLSWGAQNSSSLCHTREISKRVDLPSRQHEIPFFRCY